MPWPGWDPSNFIAAQMRKVFCNWSLLDFTGENNINTHLGSVLLKVNTTVVQGTHDALSVCHGGVGESNIDLQIEFGVRARNQIKLNPVFLISRHSFRSSVGLYVTLMLYSASHIYLQQNILMKHTKYLGTVHYLNWVPPEGFSGLWFFFTWPPCQNIYIFWHDPANAFAEVAWPPPKVV